MQEINKTLDIGNQFKKCVEMHFYLKFNDIIIRCINEWLNLIFDKNSQSFQDVSKLYIISNPAIHNTSHTHTDTHIHILEFKLLFSLKDFTGREWMSSTLLSCVWLSCVSTPQTVTGRFLYSWATPGKNTAVDWHSLIQMNERVAF